MTLNEQGVMNADATLARAHKESYHKITKIVKCVRITTLHTICSYIRQFYDYFWLILWEIMTKNAGKNMTLEHSSSAGDRSMTTDDVRVVWRTIYIRRDGNTLKEKPSKIEEYEPQRGSQNKNKGNLVTISVIKAL